MKLGLFKTPYSTLRLTVTFKDRNGENTLEFKTRVTSTF